MSEMQAPEQGGPGRNIPETEREGRACESRWGLQKGDPGEEQHPLTVGSPLSPWELEMPEAHSGHDNLGDRERSLRSQAGTAARSSRALRRKAPVLTVRAGQARCHEAGQDQDPRSCSCSKAVGTRASGSPGLHPDIEGLARVWYHCPVAPAGLKPAPQSLPSPRRGSGFHSA